MAVHFNDDGPLSPKPIDEINELRKRMATGDPKATNELCKMSNTPVPEFAKFAESQKK